MHANTNAEILVMRITNDPTRSTQEKNIQCFKVALLLQFLGCTVLLRKFAPEICESRNYYVAKVSELNCSFSFQFTKPYILKELIEISNLDILIRVRVVQFFKYLFTE